MIRRQFLKLIPFVSGAAAIAPSLVEAGSRESSTVELVPPTPIVATNSWDHDALGYFIQLNGLWFKMNRASLRVIIYSEVVITEYKNGDFIYTKDRGGLVGKRAHIRDHHRIQPFPEIMIPVDAFDEYGFPPLAYKERARADLARKISIVGNHKEVVEFYRSLKGRQSTNLEWNEFINSRFSISWRGVTHV